MKHCFTFVPFTCFILFVSIYVKFVHSLSKINNNNCTEYNNNVLKQKDILQCSLGNSAACKKYKAQGDWPDQAIYMRNLLVALIDTDTKSQTTSCLNSTVARNTVDFLNIVNVSKSEWWYTWIVFQVQYYDMPHRAGSRVETAATLGRKCWAFAYLTQIWETLKQKLQNAFIHAGTGQNLNPFIEAYDNAIPLTMNLCTRVTANCYVNATYDPEKRNGTCPDSVGQFYVGFQWENGNNNVQFRNDSVVFPFYRYTQTDEWRKNIQFAVNTALNYII